MSRSCSELSAAASAQRHRRRSRATVLVACAGAASLATGWTAAHGEEPRDAVGCPIVASAQAVQQTEQKDGDLVLNDPAGAAAPVAQACVNYPLATSTGFASGAAPKQSVQPVDYPVNVSSSYPSQPSAHDDSTPGVTLVATSAETASTARAIDGDGGASGSDANAHAGYDVSSGRASAVATSVSAPFVINGVLSIGEVHSAASARVRSGETVRRSSSVEIGRTTVNGQVVTITSDGVKAAGQTLPLPTDPGIANALQQAGIEVRYLSPEQTPHGVLSGGVLIRAKQVDPTGAAMVVEYVLGRAYAAVALPAIAVSSPSAPVRPAVGPGAPTATAPVPTSGSSATVPSLPAAGGASPVVAPIGPSSLSASGTPVRIGLTTFYLVLVVGGVVMLLSSSSVRLLGVRSR